MLDTGEVEVLATNLYDSSLYTIADLKKVYFMRWGNRNVLWICQGRTPARSVQWHTGYLYKTGLCGQSVFIQFAESD